MRGGFISEFRGRRSIIFVCTSRERKLYYPQPGSMCQCMYDGTRPPGLKSPRCRAAATHALSLAGVGSQCTDSGHSQSAPLLERHLSCTTHSLALRLTTPSAHGGPW